MVKQHNVQIVLLTLDYKTVVFGISLVLFTLTPDLSFEYLLSHVFATVGLYYFAVYVNLKGTGIAGLVLILSNLY